MPDPLARPHPSPLISEFAADPDMAGIVAEFVEELPKKIAALMKQWRSGDYAAVQVTAHQLKGACAGYGFPSIGLAASKVETALRGAGSDRIRREVERIEKDLDRLSELCARARATRH